MHNEFVSFWLRTQILHTVCLYVFIVVDMNLISINLVTVGNGYDKLEPKKDEEKEQEKYREAGGESEKRDTADTKLVVLPDQPQLGKDTVA